MKIMNGTNGHYSNGDIYWGILGINPSNGRWSYLDKRGILRSLSRSLNDANGHLSKNGTNFANIYHRTSEIDWIEIPKITSGRLYICIGSPCYIKTFDTGFAGPNIDNPSDPNINVYFDFIEFTIDDSGYHGNTTRVDGFGFPLQHRLVNRNGTYDQVVGEREDVSRAQIFDAYLSQVSEPFQALGRQQAPYRIVAPIHGAFREGGAQAKYFDNYIQRVWKKKSKPSTQNVLLCNGPLAEDPSGCAGLNRGVYEDVGAWKIPAKYYSTAPANAYAQFWHKQAIGGLAYGFAYDDFNQQAAYQEVKDPKGLILRVGW
nr:glycoside hydrolase family 64 protein [Deinococcus betulae]